MISDSAVSLISIRQRQCLDPILLFTTKDMEPVKVFEEDPRISMNPDISVFLWILSSSSM